MTGISAQTELSMLDQGAHLDEHSNPVASLDDLDDAVDAWIREAVANNTLSVEAIACAMEADGWGSHEARVLVALGMVSFGNMVCCCGM